MQTIALGFNALVVCTVILAGCASTGQLANTAVKANVAQEQAHNELLVLNILRAYERKPMHFTQISAVRLSPGIGNPTFSLSIPFGHGSPNIYNLGPTQIAVQQSVDTVVLNSQEFMRGITQPVPPSTMLYYLDQGWPQQLVLHMFVRSIEFYDASGALVARADNFPENKDEFLRFQTVLDDLRQCELDPIPELTRVFYSGRLSEVHTLNLTDLAAAKVAGLVPVSVNSQGDVPKENEKPTGVRFAVESKTAGFKLSDKPDQDCKGVTAPPSRSKKTGEAANNRNQPLNVKKVLAAADRETGRPTDTAKFLLRSPESMIYYLGEIARAQLDGQFTYDSAKRVRPPSGFPWIRRRPPRVSEEVGETKGQETLFAIDEGVSQDASLTVQYGDKTFSIPSSSTGNRSMHVLSLLSQILALQNKGTDSPTTANVRLVQ